MNSLANMDWNLVLAAIATAVAVTALYLAFRADKYLERIASAIERSKS